MQRRHFLISTIAAGTTMAHASPTNTVRTLPQALQWVEQLGQTPSVDTTGRWPLVAILEHMAQSVEMSLDGFPAPKSALFQSTVGAAAFAVFQWRGRMSHGLAEPIPGAPALTLQGDWKPAAQRLRAAILRFDGHTGALQPHFAYGQLSKSEFAQAHVLHIANHQDEIVLR
jgi:predicted component of type VI protein secretion system